MSETNAATAPVRAAGYVRVSQERNVRDGYGLASQEVDIDKIEDQFPAIIMKTPTDWKTLVSEIRELIRMLSEEVGRKRGGVKTTTLRTEITLEEVREAYAEAHVVDAEDVQGAAEAGLVELAPPGVPGPGEHVSEETGS